MINKVFGIISYLPDDNNLRTGRIKRLTKLLKTLERLWPSIDIMIIAQNWKTFKPEQIKNNLIIYSYEKLGILKARRTLRTKFLESIYDYLIMLDDDGIIVCEDGSEYMKEIDNNPNGYMLFRHTKCPLMLLAISKNIYSQIDMPQINAEKNEGFEDDIFVAQLLAKFPEYGRDFKHDTIEEISFKYEGEGAVGSTWANTEQRNWKYLRSHTLDIIRSITKIDLVVPYVDSTDLEWQKVFNKYNTKIINKDINGKERFRSQGNFFRFFFRCIEKNIPWVNNIFLLVQSKSQVPKWLDQTKVKIITHNQFIPKEYLPTFNSCTIEMFLWNIPELSNNFLYFNDDIFVINSLNIDNFFLGEKIKQNFKEDLVGGIFGEHCKNNYKLIFNTLNNFKRCDHQIKPMFKSKTKECFDTYKENILKSISRFRTTYNYNCFIYPLYLLKSNLIESSSIKSGYIEKINNNFKFSTDVLCINDTSENENIYENKYLIWEFYQRFPNKSKYELYDIDKKPVNPKAEKSKSKADGRPNCYLYF